MMCSQKAKIELGDWEETGGWGKVQMTKNICTRDKCACTAAYMYTHTQKPLEND